jgi:phosphoserine phosphatase
MAGRITYERWFELDIREWMARKRKKSDFIEIIRRLRPMRGAVETVATLRRRGYRIAVISGSLSLVLETLLPDLRFDDVLINRLVFDEDGTLTGGIATRFDMVHKATGLRTIARREGIPLSRCVYVGDNENDVHVAEAAGFSIAFNSKSRNLERVSNRVVPEKNLRRILEHL